MTRPAYIRKIQTVRALRLRAREIDKKVPIAIRLHKDRGLAQMYARDAAALRRVAKALFEDGPKKAWAVLDAIYDTVPREDAEVCMAAGGDRDALSRLTEGGRRAAYNLRERMRRRGMVARG